jgi:hypothetical protein
MLQTEKLPLHNLRLSETSIGRNNLIVIAEKVVFIESFAWDAEQLAIVITKQANWVWHHIRCVRVLARLRTVQPSPDRVFMPKTSSILAGNWTSSSGRYAQNLCMHTMRMEMQRYLG